MYRKGEENRNMFNDLRNKVRAYQANQAQTIIGAGIIGIAILVIVLVYSQVEQSLPTPTNAALASASTNVTSTFAASMDGKSIDAKDLTKNSFLLGGVGNCLIGDRFTTLSRQISTCNLDSTCSFCNLVSS